MQRDMLEQQLADAQAEAAALRGRLGATTAQLCATATPSNPALLAVLKVRQTGYKVCARLQRGVATVVLCGDALQLGSQCSRAAKGKICLEDVQRLHPNRAVRQHVACDCCAQAAVGAGAAAQGQRRGTPHEIALARVRGGAAAALSDTVPSQVCKFCQHACCGRLLLWLHPDSLTSTGCC